jgi:hypothetical protein
MAKSTLVSRIAATSFKPVDGGYLLVTSHPWLVGTGPAYIVNEAQKEALIAVMPPRRPFLDFALLLAAMIAVLFGSALGAVVIAVHNGPTMIYLLGLITVLGPAMYAFLVIMIRRKLRRMATILAHAKPLLSVRRIDAAQ